MEYSWYFGGIYLTYEMGPKNIFREYYENIFLLLKYFLNILPYILEIFPKYIHNMNLEYFEYISRI